MLPTLIPQEDADASKELAKQFGKRGITLHLEKQCKKVEDKGGALTVHFGDGETVEADLMLVSVGRGPTVEGTRASRAIGVEFDKRKGIAADEHRRTTVEHIYAVGDCAGYWQLAHTAFREGEVAAENVCGHEAVVDNRAVPRPIYTDPEIAGVGLTEAEAREQYGDDVATGMFPWVANARAVMQNETTGWVKSIHETRYGELLGLVMVGPHVTDLIEAGVVAIDAEATVETVADGMAAHPTLSEAIKEAGLVALGRAIHVPNRKRAKSSGLGFYCFQMTEVPRIPDAAMFVHRDVMASAVPELPVLARDQAFEILYRRYVKDVYHYALALLRNPADAEDVTQTTFLNAYRAYQRGIEIEKPQNWLIKIAHNVARTRYARASRRVKEVPLEDHVDQLAVPED